MTIIIIIIIVAIINITIRCFYDTFILPPYIRYSCYYVT